MDENKSYEVGCGKPHPYKVLDTLHDMSTNLFSYNRIIKRFSPPLMKITRAQFWFRCIKPCIEQLIQKKQSKRLVYRLKV